MGAFWIDHSKEGVGQVVAWMGFTALQWSLIIGVFAASAVVSERTLSGMKQESLRLILALRAEQGYCGRCLAAERKRLSGMGFAAVLAERLTLEKTVRK